jgi:SsrA-binding protein
MTAAKPAPTIVPVAQNRRATFDYELGDRFEAGIVLLGSEVKMLRNGKVDLSDSWVGFEGEEPFLRGVNIPSLQPAPFSHEAKRPRKLLLHQKEIDELKRATTRDGMTITVTKLYFKDGRAKVEIALGRGKKKYDKRETVKERDADREARQTMARARRDRS